MIKTYVFDSSNKRDEFINIIKELGFTYSLNTYTKTVSSKSNISTYGVTGTMKTVNNVMTYYEITIDKELIEEENKKFTDFEYYYFKKETPSPDARIFGGIGNGFGSTLIIRGLLALILKYIKIPYLIDIYNVDLYKYLLLGGLFLVLTKKFQKLLKPEAIKKAKEIEEKNKKIKERLINQYLGEYGKKIINKL